MGLFNQHQDTPRIDYQGHQYTLAAFIDKFNAVAAQLAQARRQLTVLRKQERDTARPLQDENSQLKQQVAQLKEQLGQAQQVEVDGEMLPIAELVQRYRQLVTQASPAKQPTDQHPSAPVRSVKPSSALIDRYYELVQAVLAEYQGKVARLQDELTKGLTDHHESELLQLVDLRTSPTHYQRLLRDRSQQLLAYLQDHPQQEATVRQGKHGFNESAPVRSLNYWRGFVSQYQQAVAALLKRNRNVRRDFQYALRYDKDLALKIAEQMPFYLSDQNVVDLQTIQDGISDEEAVKKSVNAFRFNINVSRKGADGEQAVRAALQNDAHSRAMFSLNLPYQYGDGGENSNQVDGVVVNEKGIFVLEIKNYTANKLWINPDGYAVTEKADGQQKVYKDRRGRGIVAQGTDHRAAVLQALKSDGEVYRHFRYLSKQVHILYVSTDPNTTIVTTGAGVGSDHRFVSLDKLRTVIDGASGQLRPDIIQAVAAAISNQQKGEKQFKYKCFPADPDRRVSQAWQQYAVMQALLQLNLDDLVAQRDPKILVALGQAGLRTCNGFVTSKPHQRKR